jgi:spermidine/putrescine-binding protein
MVEFSRRRVMQFFGAGALGLSSPMAGLQRANAQSRAKELNILCREGYNSAQVLDPFRSSKGATVRAESLTNDPTMINRLRGRDQCLGPDQRQQSLGAQDHAAREADQAARPRDLRALL